MVLFLLRLPPICVVHPAACKHLVVAVVVVFQQCCCAVAVVDYVHRWSEVPAEMKCTICTYPLLIRGFYLFPCQHSFHIDCLVNDVSSTSFQK